jgi:hypothetical protein
VAGMILQLYTRNGQQVKRAKAAPVKHLCWTDSSKVIFQPLSNAAAIRGHCSNRALQPQKSWLRSLQPKDRTGKT